MCCPQWYATYWLFSRLEVRTPNPDSLDTLTESYPAAPSCNVMNASTVIVAVFMQDL
jgi:hypothetical protein